MRGYARTTSQVHYGPTLRRILFNTLVSWGPRVEGTMPVNIKHKLYKFTHVSVRKTCRLSVGTFKDQNRWFLPPKLYTFMFGHQPSVEANTRPRIICMSWWSNVSTVTSWIGIAPETFAACHLLSPVSPAALHCQLANKVKMTWKIIFKKKKSIHCV